MVHAEDANDEKHSYVAFRGIPGNNFKLKDLDNKPSAPLHCGSHNNFQGHVHKVFHEMFVPHLKQIMDEVPYGHRFTVVGFGAGSVFAQIFIACLPDFRPHDKMVPAVEGIFLAPIRAGDGEFDRMLQSTARNITYVVHDQDPVPTLLDDGVKMHVHGERFLIANSGKCAQSDMNCRIKLHHPNSYRRDFMKNMVKKHNEYGYGLAKGSLCGMEVPEYVYMTGKTDDAFTQCNRDFIREDVASKTEDYVREQMDRILETVGLPKTDTLGHEMRRESLYYAKRFYKTFLFWVPTSPSQLTPSPKLIKFTSDLLFKPMPLALRVYLKQSFKYPAMVLTVWFVLWVIYKGFVFLFFGGKKAKDEAKKD